MAEWEEENFILIALQAGIGVEDVPTSYHNTEGRIDEDKWENAVEKNWKYGIKRKSYLG